MLPANQPDTGTINRWNHYSKFFLKKKYFVALRKPAPRKTIIYHFFLFSFVVSRLSCFVIFNGWYTTGIPSGKQTSAIDMIVDPPGTKNYPKDLMQIPGLISIIDYMCVNLFYWYRQNGIQRKIISALELISGNYDLGNVIWSLKFEPWILVVTV